MKLIWQEGIKNGSVTACGRVKEHVPQTGMENLFCLDCVTETTENYMYTMNIGTNYSEKHESSRKVFF